MISNPNESAPFIAKAYNVDLDVAKSALANLTASSKKSGVPYFEPGRFRIDAMNNMIRAQKLVGAIDGDPEWAGMIDQQFLPDDLRSNIK
jgi:hypothetical protein